MTTVFPDKMCIELLRWRKEAWRPGLSSEFCHLLGVRPQGNITTSLSFQFLHLWEKNSWGVHFCFNIPWTIIYNLYFSLTSNKIWNNSTLNSSCSESHRYMSKSQKEETNQSHIVKAALPPPTYFSCHRDTCLCLSAITKTLESLPIHTLMALLRPLSVCMFRMPRRLEAQRERPLWWGIKLCSVCLWDSHHATKILRI